MYEEYQYTKEQQNNTNSGFTTSGTILTIATIFSIMTIIISILTIINA